MFDDRRRELRRELAFAYDAELGRPDAALAYLRALLDAGDAALLGRETLDRVELACLRLLRAESNFVELERRLAHRLDRIGGAAAEWLDLALLREETLRRTSAALDAYRVALERDPANLDALRGMRRTAERLGRWRDVAEALERELECARDRDPAERGALLRALADIHWHRLSSTTRASRYYAAALEANAADFAALRALERLLESMEDWRGALDLYESEAEVLGTANPKRRREIWLHVASLAHERAGDPERARQALRRAGEIEPLDTAAARGARRAARARRRSRLVRRRARQLVRRARRGRRRRRIISGSRSRSKSSAGSTPRRRASKWPSPRTPRTRRSGMRPRGCAPRSAIRSAARGRSRVRPTTWATPRSRPRGCAKPRARSAAQDPREALELLRAAVERSPGDAAAQAARAHLAAQLGKDDEAELAARAALEIAPGSLDTAARAAVARTGADAARRRGRAEIAASLYAEALRLEPDDAIALGAYGETLVALGDHPAARSALERAARARRALPGARRALRAARSLSRARG